MALFWFFCFYSEKVCVETVHLANAVTHISLGYNSVLRKNRNEPEERSICMYLSITLKKKNLFLHFRDCKVNFMNNIIKKVCRHELSHIIFSILLHT